jgi:hypothetical protein
MAAQTATRVQRTWKYLGQCFCGISNRSRIVVAHAGRRGLRVRPDPFGPADALVRSRSAPEQGRPRLVWPVRRVQKDVHQFMRQAEDIGGATGDSKILGRGVARSIANRRIARGRRKRCDGVDI